MKSTSYEPLSHHLHGEEKPLETHFVRVEDAMKVNDKVVADNPKESSFGLENVLKSRHPMNLAFCPNCCEDNIRTRTRTYPSAVTWTAVAVSAITFFPFFWVPLVVDNMKQTDHYCQKCGQKLATIKALQGSFAKEEY